jgi:transcriptional regulator of acetoin/glycerol metabolism/DNA-binding CsgD family transcriptional regulator
MTDTLIAPRIATRDDFSTMPTDGARRAGRAQIEHGGADPYRGQTAVTIARSSRAGRREALDQLLAGEHVGVRVRPEILESWRRSASYGLQPDRIVPSHSDSFREDDLLERAAGPVLTGLTDDLAGTNSTVVLTDHRGLILHRCTADQPSRDQMDRIYLAPGFLWSEHHVGTTGMGTALERRAATFVAGEEHFANAFTTICGAGAPVIEPRSGRVVGVVSVLRRAYDATGLMMPLARRAARDVEQRLREELGGRERLLHDHFQLARRHVRGPLALVTRDILLTNAPAARLLGQADGAALWAWASDAGDSGVATPSHVGLEGARSVLATCEPVREGTEMVAVLVRMFTSGTEVPRAPTRRHPSVRARFGWASLTETELVITELVAEGRTNREIAERLFLSRHTIDSHIRHIYCKLGIASRVQLTRLVLSNSDPDRRTRA